MATSEQVSADNVAATEAAAAARTNTEDPADNAPNPDKLRPDDNASEAQDTGDARPKKSKKFDLRDRFLELSGYEKRDIGGSNDERRTVVTTNGGKYEVSAKGTRLRKLSGPDTPNDRESREEEDDD